MPPLTRPSHRLYQNHVFLYASLQAAPPRHAFLHRLISLPDPRERSRAAAASGLGAGNQALGEGSAGANKPRQGADSQAGGREMNDSDASLKGDTVRLPLFVSLSWNPDARGRALVPDIERP